MIHIDDIFTGIMEYRRVMLNLPEQPFSDNKKVEWAEECKVKIQAANEKLQEILGPEISNLIDWRLYESID